MQCEVFRVLRGAVAGSDDGIDWKPTHPRIFHERNVVSQANIVSDKGAIELLYPGRHDTVIAQWDSDYRKAPWEAFGVHYLQRVGAMGGAECNAKGTALSDCENARGTGNIHIWFDAL